MKKLVALCALAAAVSVPAMADGTGTTPLDNYASVSGSHTFEALYNSNGTWTPFAGSDANNNPVVDVTGFVETYAKETFDATAIAFHFNGQQAPVSATFSATTTINSTANQWVTGVECPAGPGSLKILQHTSVPSAQIPVDWKASVNGAAAVAGSYANSDKQQLWWITPNATNTLVFTVTATPTGIPTAGSYVLDPVVVLKPVL